jgi:hypothetical protein
MPTTVNSTPLTRAPARAGIDPYHELIDRVTRDNAVAVTGPD